MSAAFSASDADLLRRARRGDVQAFGLLVGRYQDYVYNAACHLVGSAVEAEDISQDVFLRAYGNLARFEGRAKFSTWLYGIMLNAVRSHWRRRAGHATFSLDDFDGDDEDSSRADPPDAADGPPREAERREQVQSVRRAIGCLEPDLREILVLRDIQGLSYEELAEALSVPSGTVKSRLHRARQALKERLEPLYGMPGRAQAQGSNG